MTAAGAGGPIVNVDWIAARLGDPELRLVEVDVSRTAYDSGHILGASLWNAYADLRDERYMPVEREDLERLVSSAGIAPDTTVVVYGYGAPLGFWLLKAYGHADVRMLMGLREQWAESGHQWSTAAPEPAAGVHPLIEDAKLLASRQAVEAAIRNPADVLLDVRSEDEYTGERFWPSGATADVGRAGHIPGAVNLPIDWLRTKNGTLKSADEIERILEAAGVTRDKSVVTYCTIGNRASEAWFALTQLLGYPDVRVYYGSWVEWGKASDTPVEQGSSLASG